MASSEAAKRAVKKYDQEKIDRIAMRVPKGKRAVDETIERDQEKKKKAD